MNPCYDTTTNGAYLLQVSSQLLPDSGVVPNSAEFSLNVNDSYSNVVTQTKTSHKITTSVDPGPPATTYYRAATVFRLRGVQFTSTYTYTIDVHWYDGKTVAGSDFPQFNGAVIPACGT